MTAVWGTQPVVQTLITTSTTVIPFGRAPAPTPPAPMPLTSPTARGTVLASFHIALPDRQRVVVDAATAATTLLDVAAAAGLVVWPNPATHMAVDGVSVPAVRLLADSGIGHGSRLALRSDRAVDAHADPDGTLRSVQFDAVWVAGVDAGGTSSLDVGTHVVGRSRSASVRCDDPALEPHHAQLEVGADGMISVVQLCGVHPIMIDGTPVEGPTVITPGQRIDIGASVLVLRSAPPTGADRAHVAAPVRAVGDPWRRPHVRAPRSIGRFEPEEIVAPRVTRPPTGIAAGLLPTVLGVAGAGILALLFHQLMFLLFGLMGAVVAFGTWLAQRLGLVRSRRRSAMDHERALMTFGASLNNQRDRARMAIIGGSITPGRAITEMTGRSSALWTVRADDPDAFTVAIGEGNGTWQPLVTGLGDAPPEVWGVMEAASQIGTVPVCASLGDGCVVAVAGADDAVAVVRSMLVQLAAASGPADWCLAIATDRPGLWDGLGWLAHIADAGGRLRLVDSGAIDEMVAGLDAGDARHLVFVLDGADLLSTRTSPLRRVLAGARSTACIVVCAAESEISAVCTSALLIGRRGCGRWIADTRASALAVPVRIAGMSAARAHDAAAAIACLTDPESLDDSSALPNEVTISALLAGVIGTEPDTFAHRIADHWSRASADPAPSAPIGVAADGTIEIDLVRDGPHALLAGTTGAGKSELLRTVVLALATRLSPDHVAFVLVDYKGGATFDACSRLPHVVGVVTDLDDRLAARALRSLEAELRRRELLLRTAGVSDVAAYRHALAAGRATEVLPRLVVVVDEFATLAGQQPEFIGSLLGIAQRGRSLGVHLLLATQRPSGVVSDDIRANTNLRIALRVQDGADSVDVIGDPAASRLPRSVPGRAIMRLGDDERVLFQTACSTMPMRRAGRNDALSVRRLEWTSSEGRMPRPDAACTERSELAVLVDAVCHAAQIIGSAPPLRPWLEPLPSMLLAGQLDAMGSEHSAASSAVGVVVGIVDDPDHQRRLPLTWATGDGHLLIVGSVGSGTTSALVAIAAALGRSEPPIEFYVIDALGDARLAETTGWPKGVVRLHERERMMRLLDHLVASIELGRSASTCHAPRIVVVVDGLAALRSAWEADEQWHQLEQLDVIIGDGLAAGVQVVLTTTRAAAVPSRMLAQIATRWIMHVVDPLEVGVLGVAADQVPHDIPGRLFDMTSRCEAQLMLLPSGDGERLGGAPLSDDSGRTDAALAHLRELVASVSVASLPDAVAAGGDILTPIGVLFQTLQPCILPIATGEHVLVIGPARSGRTTALLTIANRWRTAHRAGWVGCVGARRSSAFAGTRFPDIAALLAALSDALSGDVPALVVIDDAELVDDPSGRLAALISDRRDGVTVVAAGRPDALRASYGHWTGAVRRSRLGLVMAAATEFDADLLGAVVPRRPPIAARPGLAWLVADGDHHLLQLATATME